MRLRPVETGLFAETGSACSHIEGPDVSNAYFEEVAWQRSMALATRCYAVTDTFVRDDTSDLAWQIRRTANAVPAAIAKGFGRAASRELQRQLRLAHGSLCELETMLLLATHAGYCDACDVVDILTLAETVGKDIQATFGSAHHRVSDWRRDDLRGEDGWNWVSSFTPTPTSEELSPARRHKARLHDQTFAEPPVARHRRDRW